MFPGRQEPGRQLLIQCHALGHASIMWPLCRVSYLKSRTPTPQASYHTPRKRWTWSPRRGTSPPLDRTSGLPSKAAVVCARAASPPSNPAPLMCGTGEPTNVWAVSCLYRPPLCEGRGAPPSWGGAHNLVSVCSLGGAVPVGGIFLETAPHMRGTVTRTALARGDGS